MKISAAQQEVLDRLEYSSSAAIEVNFTDKDGYHDAAITSSSSRDNLRISTFKVLFRADLIEEVGRTHHLGDHWVARFRLAEKVQ